MGKNKVFVKFWPLNQTTRCFSIFRITRLVLQLTPFHHWDADAKEKCGYGNGTEDEPVETVKGSVHHPNAPPHHNFAKIVGVTTMSP